MHECEKCKCVDFVKLQSTNEKICADCLHVMPLRAAEKVVTCKRVKNKD